MENQIKNRSVFVCWLCGKTIDDKPFAIGVENKDKDSLWKILSDDEANKLINPDVILCRKCLEKVKKALREMPGHVIRRAVRMVLIEALAGYE